MPQSTLGRPLDEPNLRHQLRPDPLHVTHLISGHAAAILPPARHEGSGTPIRVSRQLGTAVCLVSSQAAAWQGHLSHGGARVTASLIDAGLVDELRLIACPLIAGEGKALFATTKRRHGLATPEASAASGWARQPDLWNRLTERICAGRAQLTSQFSFCPEPSGNTGRSRYAALWKSSIWRIQLVSGFHLGKIWATTLHSVEAQQFTGITIGLSGRGGAAKPAWPPPPLRRPCAALATRGKCAHIA